MNFRAYAPAKLHFVARPCSRIRLFTPIYWPETAGHLFRESLTEYARYEQNLAPVMSLVKECVSDEEKRIAGHRPIKESARDSREPAFIADRRLEHALNLPAALVHRCRNIILSGMDGVASRRDVHARP